MIWAVASRKGSPGATTLAVLLGHLWPGADEPRFVVEADPEGGVLAARWHAALGTTHEPGLLTLAAARDGSAIDRLHRHAQPLVAGLRLVAGPPGPAQADASLRALGAAAPNALAGAPVQCFVDCGRLDPASVALPLARAAQRVLLVARPRLDEVVALRAVAESLSGAGLALGLVCIGDRPFHPLEVADQAGVPLTGVIPDDPSAAALVRDGALGGRGLRRSRLARSVSELAARLATSAPTEAAELVAAGADG